LTELEIKDRIYRLSQMLSDKVWFFFWMLPFRLDIIILFWSWYNNSTFRIYLVDKNKSWRRESREFWLLAKIYSFQEPTIENMIIQPFCLIKSFVIGQWCN
jgi:hypothetical protein